VVDGTKIADRFAGVDCHCVDHESELFTVNNMLNILQQTSVNAIMAVGMTLVILTSGIDLSVGSLLALTGAVAASLVGMEVNALVAVAAALALGAAIGAVTGTIVAKGRVQAFIATLVMMLLLRGVTLVYTNGSPINTGLRTMQMSLAGSVLVVRWGSRRRYGSWRLSLSPPGIYCITPAWAAISMRLGK
jgi:ribose/xylose/arabinose/galactoside ABC-type transport system permease subunit